MTHKFRAKLIFLGAWLLTLLLGIALLSALEWWLSGEAFSSIPTAAGSLIGVTPFIARMAADNYLKNCGANVGVRFLDGLFFVSLLAGIALGICAFAYIRR